MQFPELVEKPIYYLDNRLRKVETHKLLMDKNTGNKFAVASKMYKPTLHEDMLEVIDDVLYHAPEYGKVEKDIVLYDDGGKMEAKYRFPEIKVDIGDGDMVNPQISVLNSYDLGWARSILFGAFRLVCSNGLVIGRKLFEYKQKHSTPFDRQEVKNTLIMSMEQFSDQTQIWKRWVDEIVTFEKYEEVIEKLPLAQKDVVAIGNEVEISSNIMIDDIKTRTLTMMLFFNILCQYTTHRVQSHMKRINIENGMRKVFYGR